MFYNFEIMEKLKLIQNFYYCLIILASALPFPLSTTEKGSLAAKRNVKRRYENDDHGQDF